MAGPARTERNNRKTAVDGIWIPCPHCSQSFKRQGFKRHETACRSAKDGQKEIEEYNRHFERQMRNGLWSHR